MDSKSELSTTYRNQINRSTLIDVLIGLGSLGLTSWLIYLFTELNSEVFFLWSVIAIYVLIGFHSIVLFINYWYYGKGLKISISDKAGIIEVEKDGKCFIYKTENIEHLEIHESASLPRYGLSYSYLKIYLTTREVVIITSLMTNKFTIPDASIKPIRRKSFFPFINTNYVIENSKEDRYRKLIKHFEKYKSSKLEEISSSNGYHDISKKAALQILEKRKTKHNKT